MAQFIIHTTLDGDRWDQIAHRYLSDAHRYPDLIAMNPHAPIQAILPGGLKLSIPVESLEKQLRDSDLPPWKRRRP